MTRRDIILLLALVFGMQSLTPIVSAKETGLSAGASSGNTSQTQEMLEETDGAVVPRKALVIGMRYYEYLEEIPSGVLDAQTFGKKLESLGFSVAYSLDDTYGTAWRKIRTFENTIQPGDVAIVYFSGHGFQFNGLNYLSVKDTPQNIKEDDLILYTIPLDSVVERLKMLNPGFSTILLDACRTNTSNVTPNETHETAKGGAGFAEIRNPPINMVIGFSASFGKTAQSSTDSSENSPYTKHLNRYIDKTDTDIVDILIRDVGLAVTSDPSLGQIPETRVTPAGFFYPKRSEKTDALEKSTWITAVQYRRYQDIEDFLLHWPVGIYSTQARTWLSANMDLRQVQSANKDLPSYGLNKLKFQGSRSFVEKIEWSGLTVINPLQTPDGAEKIYGNFSNIATLENAFAAYSTPNSTHPPTALLRPGKKVTVVAPRIPDENNSNAYFTKILVNPNTDEEKSLYIKDASDVRNFASLPTAAYVDLKPITDQDIENNTVRVKSISYGRPGTPNPVFLDVPADLALSDIKPYLEAIYRSLGKSTPLDFNRIFSSVRIQLPANQDYGAKTKQAVLYLRNLQVSNLLEQIGILRANTAKAFELNPQPTLQTGNVDRLVFYFPVENQNRLEIKE